MGENPNKNESNNYLEQALAELEPVWKILKGIKPHELPWEFLRRNEEYHPESAEALKAWLEYQSTGNPDDLERAFKLTKAIKEKYGLRFPIPPDQKIGSERAWAEELNVKYWSNAKVRSSVLEPGKAYIELNDNEELLVVNFNAPPQAYTKEIEEMYEQRGIYERQPRMQPDKYITYLKVYDLRQWGIKRGLSKKDKAGKIVSEPSWEDIAGSKAVYPNSPKMTVQGVKKNYASAEQLINGDYKRLLRYRI